MGIYQFRRGLLASAAIMLTAPSVVAAQNVQLLPEVVVSASRVPLPSAEVGSAVTVITGEELRQKQTRIVSDVLREIPGVAVSRNGPTGSFSQVRIRGAEANHTLVLLDGVEVNDPSGASEFDFSTLLADDIERIEVLRGPQSALYGSEAIGGVINIITRKGEGPATVRTRAETGAFGTVGGGLNVSSGELGQFDYALGLSALRTDGVSSAPERQGNSENDGYENLTGRAKIGWQPTEYLEFELFGQASSSEVESDPQPAVAGVIRVVDGDVVTSSQQKFGRAQAKLFMFDGDWEQIIAAGYAEDNQDTFTNGAKNFVAVGEKARMSYQSNFFLETPEYAQASHVFTFLAEREYEAQTTRSAFGDSDLDIVNHGFVGEYRLGLFDRLFLSGSARYDDNDIFDDATTLRATASYAVLETDTRLHGSIGEGVKNPTLFELFGFGPNFVPNPNLEPESSIGWDVGIEQTFFGGRALVDVTYFENRIQDLIQGAGNTAVNLAGTSKIRGIETTLRAAVTPTTVVSAQFTYQDAKDAAGAPLIRRPDVTASFNINQSFLADRASIDIGIDYHGDQKDLQFSNFFANQQQVTLDAYTLVNVGASYVLSDSVEVFGRVENLLDEQYEDVFGFDNPGVGVFVGLRARFGFF